LEERAAADKIRGLLRGRRCGPLVFWLRDAWHGKHRVWLPAVSCLIAILFFAAGILFLLFGPFSPTLKT
jgi:hypothetical protein